MDQYHMDDYSPLQGVDSSVCSQSLTLNRTVSENVKLRPSGRTAKQNAGHLHRECGKTQKSVRRGKPYKCLGVLHFAKGACKV